MNKITVVYWSQSGNTEAMAEAMAKGLSRAEKKQSSCGRRGFHRQLKEADVFALGCPAMGDEVLEEDEMEPFVAHSEIARKALLQVRISRCSDPMDGVMDSG